MTFLRFGRPSCLRARSKHAVVTLDFWRGRPGLLVSLAVLCAVTPELPPHFASRGAGTASSVATAFPSWIHAPLPPGLTPLALDVRTARFAASFPGKIAGFTDGRKTWIVRWVTQPTRKLHPASDCLRAMSYRITPEAAYVDSHGALWSTITASREGKAWCVHERIFACDGSTGWSDVSAWFWQTTWTRARGPWWAITVLSPDLASE